MRKIFAIVVATAPMISSGAPAPMPPPKVLTTIKTAYVVSPEIGKAAAAEVGETLYSETTRVTTTRYAATLTEAASSDMENGYKIRFNARRPGKVLTRGNFGEWMMCGPAQWSGVVGFFGDKNVDGCLVDRGNDGVFESATFPLYAKYFPLAAPVPYTLEETNEDTDMPDGFRIQVLYQGVSKGELKISYREFQNNLARPAFNQDVTYEINHTGPTLIGFKGMRIRVLKADSQRIEYILDQAIPSNANTRRPIE